MLPAELEDKVVSYVHTSLGHLGTAFAHFSCEESRSQGEKLNISL